MASNSGNPQPWRLLNEEIVFETPWFQIRKQHMRTPSGVETDYYVHENGDSVMCICVNNENKVLIERQYRPPVQKVCVDYPCGRMEENDKTTEQALRRELLEETGFTVTNLKKLGVVDKEPGFSTTRLHIFLAQGLTEGTPAPEETEHIITTFVEPSKILSMVASGEMSCMLCVSATLFAFKEMGWLTFSAAAK